MMSRSPADGRGHETAGFLASLAFACLASVRDVYFGGLFQSTSPLDVAIAAFSLCGAVFLPVALVRNPGSLRRLLGRPRELVWINATTALAWISFFYALRTIEPLLVQILHSGIGPLSVVWLERRVIGAAPTIVTPHERRVHLGLLASLVFAAAVALAGLSGAGPQRIVTVALGMALAAGSGVSISVSTMLCRRLNEVGVDPAALVSLRFLGATGVAAALAVSSGHDVVAGLSRAGLPVVAGASLLLIVLPIYVNQVGISLASPLTVRAVLALGPVLIFVLQLVEGRLSPSPYSLAVAILYGVFAVATAMARRRRGAVSAVARTSPGLP